MGGTFDRALRALLSEAGCYCERQSKGSHEWWYSPINGRHFTVPHNIKSRHTANEILKQAGLGKRL
jgi:predicted RNA binding protein YcfA (HicA-like mRNA interferase family)